MSPRNTDRGRRCPEKERGARSTGLQPITGELPLFVRDECSVAAHGAVDEVVDLDAERSSDVGACVPLAYELQHGVPIKGLARRHHHREVRMEDRGEAGELGVSVLEGSVEPTLEELVQADDLGPGARGDVDVVTLRKFLRRRVDANELVFVDSHICTRTVSSN
jgi:hypothetical protein